jgi:PAS domain S-box-containing protein
MEHMLSQGIRRPKDLCELSCGVMPQEISDAVMDAIGCRQIVALAISYAEELIGTCVAYLSGDRPVVPDDALQTYIYLSSIAVKRRWAEEASQYSEKRYRRLFELAKDGILILDDDTGKVVDVNPFLLHLLGYSYEELYGQYIWDLGVFKDIAASKDAFQTLQDNEYIRYDDLPLETRDGHPIAVEFVSNIYLVDHSKVIQCNIRDISERKQAEKEKSKLQDQFLQSQKMESVARLAGGVAHDFNNMLRVILGHTEMAMEQVDPAQDALCRSPGNSQCGQSFRRSYPPASGLCPQADGFSQSARSKRNRGGDAENAATTYWRRYPVGLAALKGTSNHYAS